MPKGSKRNRLARVRELCDFDESLVTRRHGDTEIPKSGQGDMETRGHRDLYLPRVFPSPRPLVAGFDEAGRGALAGPVVVGCIHFPFFSTNGQESVFTLSPVRDVSIRACPPTLRLCVSSNAACQRLSLLALTSHGSSCDGSETGQVSVGLRCERLYRIPCAEQDHSQGA